MCGASRNPPQGSLLLFTLSAKIEISRRCLLYSFAEFHMYITIRLRCADSPDLCNHVRKHDSSVGGKQAGQLNSAQRQKTSEGLKNKKPENAEIQGR